MAYAMTKRGSQDNIITYEFICDNMNDLDAIENKYKTIGTIAIVLEGESDGLEVYICGSNKEWSNLGAMGASGSNNESTGGLSIYICSQEEVSEGLPDVDDPDESTIYLVPASETSGNLYDEYIYVDGNWEKFGGGTATIDLSDYIQKTDIATQSTAGLVKVLDNGNVTFNESNQLVLTLAGTAVVKTGQSDHPISVTHQHEAAFYGLAKAAGQDMKNSDNAVGTYTTEAAAAIRSMIGAGTGTYSKPSGGIPAADLAESYVKFTDYASSNTAGVVKVNANGLYMNNGILETDKASDTNIRDGDSIYKPIVPSNQHKSVFYGLAKAAGDSTQSASSNAVGTYTDDAKAAIQSMIGIGIATADNAGLVKVLAANGIGIDGTSHRLYLVAADSATIKTSTSPYFPLTPNKQHESVFYGLAKAAGDATQAASSNSVGTYTSGAQAAIRNMLGVGSAVALTEEVSGSTPSITGQPNVTYTCGEVSTLGIIPPSNGTCSVIFTSGSTATVLTVPNTVKFPSWFDATSLDANTIYEIMITNGVYGSVMTWAT